MKETWIVTKFLNFQLRGSTRGIVVDNEGYVYWSSGLAGGGTYRLHRNMYNAKYKDWQPYHILVNEQYKEFKAMTWNGKDTIYMADSDGRIFKYSVESQNVSLWMGKDAEINYLKYDFIRGIAMDKNGDVWYTADRKIKKINIQTKTVEDVIFAEDGEDGMRDECNHFHGIAISDDDTIYVCDWSNHCIQKVKDGVMKVFAGQFSSAGSDDGKLEECKFRNPDGMIFDKDGNLIVADWSGLRKIDMKKCTVTNIVKGESCTSLGMDDTGVIYFGTSYGELFRAENVWKRERLVWIGHLKENSKECFLASIPKDIIKEICGYLVTGERHIPEIYEDDN